MANMRLGSELGWQEKQAVLRSYVYRYTGDHRPGWAKPDSPVQFKDDADWLANTKFAVTKAGGLDKRVNHCESNPTWPNGKGG